MGKSDGTTVAARLATPARAKRRGRRLLGYRLTVAARAVVVAGSAFGIGFAGVVALRLAGIAGGLAVAIVVLGSELSLTWPPEGILASRDGIASS